MSVRRRHQLHLHTLVPKRTHSALSGDHVGMNPADYTRELTALMICRCLLCLIHDRKLSFRKPATTPYESRTAVT
jgi:hypothetical protein